MKNVSFRVIIFYAVAVVFIAAMIITANGDLDGFWQLMQLFGGITGIVGITTSIAKSLSGMCLAA
jgi:hypothetical protein